MLVRKVLFLGLLGALVLTACGPPGYKAKTQERSTLKKSAEDPQGGPAVYRTLTLDQFADIVANQSSEYAVINVHVPYAGEIEGTDTHTPYNDIEALMAFLPNKEAPIILYCASGRMSEEASRNLIRQGYTQVWDVPGGMNAWRASGRELKP